MLLPPLYINEVDSQNTNDRDSEGCLRDAARCVFRVRSGCGINYFSSVLYVNCNFHAKSSWNIAIQYLCMTVLYLNWPRFIIVQEYIYGIWYAQLALHNYFHLYIRRIIIYSSWISIIISIYIYIYICNSILRLILERPTRALAFI